MTILTNSWLRDALERARELGFLGPGPIDLHIEHALGFSQAFSHALELPARSRGNVPGAVLHPPGKVLDLGSGGGVPALVLALLWPDAEIVLLEASGRRCDHLRRAVIDGNFSPRVRVEEARAEEYAGVPGNRESFDIVTSRSFGTPSVVAECAGPLLRPGGILIVSEPPEKEPGELDNVRIERWPASGLAPLGMEPLSRHTGTATFQILVRSGPCTERFPRRSAASRKRPLF